MLKSSIPSLARTVLNTMVLTTALITGCGAEPFYWYEEAQQDDGSIVMVKTIETASSQSRSVPSAQIYGYRFIQIEFEGPKSNQKFIWKPGGIPSLEPLALHFDKGVPYIFAFPYTGAYEEYGCPLPPYIIFRWTGSSWTRISVAELPIAFHRTNLLTSSGERIIFEGMIVPVTNGMTVKAAMIDRSRFVPAGSFQEYFYKLDFRKLGSLNCNQNNIPTQYDHLDVK